MIEVALASHGQIRQSADISSLGAPKQGQGEQAVEQQQKESTNVQADFGKRLLEQDRVTLSDESSAQLQQLQQRDQEVKSHEQAHITAGGSHVVGGASFSYQKGPDGQQYAVGGEVQISTGAVPGDPAATLEKASTVMRSALAPSNPSAQDMAVAASAAQTIATARLELAQQQSATTEQVGEGRLRSQQSALATEYALHGQGLAAERNRTETAINQFV